MKKDIPEFTAIDSDIPIIHTVAYLKALGKFISEEGMNAEIARSAPTERTDAEITHLLEKEPSKQVATCEFKNITDMMCKILPPVYISPYPFDVIYTDSGEEYPVEKIAKSFTSKEKLITHIVPNMYIHSIYIRGDEYILNAFYVHGSRITMRMVATLVDETSDHN